MGGHEQSGNHGCLIEKQARYRHTDCGHLRIELFEGRGVGCDDEQHQEGTQDAEANGVRDAAAVDVIAIEHVDQRDGEDQQKAD